MGLLHTDINIAEQLRTNKTNNVKIISLNWFDAIRTTT